MGVGVGVGVFVCVYVREWVCVGGCSSLCSLFECMCAGERVVVCVCARACVCVRVCARARRVRVSMRMCV